MGRGSGSSWEGWGTSRSVRACFLGSVVAFFVKTIRLYTHDLISTSLQREAHFKTDPGVATRGRRWPGWVKEASRHKLPGIR